MNLKHMCDLLVCTCHVTTLATVWRRVKEPFGTCTGTEVLARRRRVPANRLAVIVDYTSLLRTDDRHAKLLHALQQLQRGLTYLYISTLQLPARGTCPFHVSGTRIPGAVLQQLHRVTGLVQRYSSYSDYSGPGRGSAYKL